MAKEFLSSVSLASCLPSTPLVSVTTGCRLDAAIQTLRENTILSCPVLKGVRLTQHALADDLACGASALPCSKRSWGRIAVPECSSARKQPTPAGAAAR